MNLKERIIENFKDLCLIPRASGDEKKVSDFIKKFAEDRGFPVYQDSKYNLIINVPGTCGMENHDVCALQGHMDMVYVKNDDSCHVYENGIRTKIEGDKLTSAEGTSLGADDGLAGAYCMTLMEDMTIPHPPLEIIMTVEEETCMGGAENLDLSSLKAKNLINLDSEREGEFITSCAGGVTNHFIIPMGARENVENLVYYKPNLFGLQGGHSGIDIDKGRGNAILLLARMLKEADSEKVHLAKFARDGKINAIPSSCTAIVGVEKDYEEEFVEKINKTFKDIAYELKFSDTPSFNLEKLDGTYPCYKNEGKERLYNAAAIFPFGVLARSMAIEGLTETSINTGIAEEIGDTIVFKNAGRSCVRSKKLNMLANIETIANILGCKSENYNDYPQWDYNPDSKLLKTCLRVYKEVSGKEGTSAAIHGGLECGYFYCKRPDIDFISMGCDLHDVHSPKETASVSSIYRVWDLLLAILKEL